MGFNEVYIIKKYEKINVNLRNEEDVQFFRTTIFENEKKGKKKDVYVVIDREMPSKEDEKVKDIENLNLINNKKNEDNNIDNINKKKEKKDMDEIIESSENEENEENENNEIYQPTSMIIKNVGKHEEEEADFEFYIDNENKNIDNLIDLKSDLNNEE